LRLVVNGASGSPTPDLDVLSIVEAAYSIDGSLPAWTAGLLHAADRALGGRLGAFACGFRSQADGRIVIDRASAAVVRQAPEVLGAIFDGLTGAPPGWLSSYLTEGRSAARCLMTSEVDPSAQLSYRARLARDGVHDGINLACVDLDGDGMLLSVGVPSHHRLELETRANLSRVATHILAALRLRKRLAASAAQTTSGGPSRAEGVAGDAVLSADGRLLNASGEAALAGGQRALREAVRNIERARTTLRSSTGHALALWKGLVSARWTLVDAFDAEGAKYIVARENAPKIAGIAGLTPTERSVVTYAVRGFSTKEIAYTLGISDTTVRVLLMRAARRCGVRSRDELLQIGRSAAAAAARAGTAPEGPEAVD
jgi:DNA-binding CsgD family transcriptional regulator